MAVIKCKMCGGDLQLTEGASTAECAYCGSLQTVPKVDDEKKLTLFGRANRLRSACEFDKAAGVYEAIVADFPEEAEAYWGLVLCKYGIEYVDDPATGRKIPTCHRSSFDSILDDSDLEQALENADSIARRLYREEAKAIELLRKGIVAVSANEAPYDIFICYKETGENGERTMDSVLAQDVYDALTGRGYRVFFARISLEDKLGMEYEPYIFAALNSAKIMLAFGTDYEYFNAVWVKNEWSRFLKLMVQDKSRHLIPCYKGIDAYDMPKEFAKLQAQDLGKIGATQDLLRGIEKILPRQKETPAAGEALVIQQAAASTAPLLKRAFMFLEDGNWARADEFCEQVLNIDPENAQAYLGKLMAEMRVSKQDDLKNCRQPFLASNHFQKAIRFADAELKAALNGYIDFIKTRNENARKDTVYSNGQSLMARHTVADYESAIGCFRSIPGWKDADQQVAICKARIAELQAQAEADRLAREQQAEIDRKDAIYRTGLGRMTLRTVEGCNQAIEFFQSIPGWKDADEQIAKCENMIVNLKLEAEERERQAAITKKRRTKNALIIVSAAVACVIALVVLFAAVIPSIQYNKGQAYMDAGDYRAAMDTFIQAGGWKDAEAKRTEAFIALKGSYKETADQLLASGDHVQAAVTYIQAGEPALAKQAYDFSTKLRAGWAASAAVTSDGQLLYKADRDTLKGSGGANVLAISSFDDYDGIIGIDGTGKVFLQEGSYDFASTGMKETVLSWRNVKQLVYGYSQTFALLEDGTVVAAYDDPDDSSYYPVDTAMNSWENIVQIGSFSYGLWGLDAEGKLHYAPCTEKDYAAHMDIREFTSVKKVQYANSWLLGVTTDGKLLAAANKASSSLKELPLDLSDFDGNVSDIIVSSSWIHILKTDGTVVPVYWGYTYENYDYSGYIRAVENGLGSWQDIVYIRTVAYGIIGRDIYGNTHYQSTDYDSEKNDQVTVYTLKTHDDVKNTLLLWQDLVYVSSCVKTYDYANVPHILAVRADGTVLSLGTGKYYTLEETTGSAKYDYYADMHYDGTYDQVDGWKLW